MKVGVGYSDNPDSAAAGVQAAGMAIDQAGRSDPCDMALLFSTARHDQRALREAVASVLGEQVPVYGGGTVGIITNEYYGYAGDQIAAACIWLDDAGCEILVEEGLAVSEEETGVRLGKRLAELGTTPDSPVMLFYDALDCSAGVRMLMATWLLSGIEKGLGFIPDLTGAGLMGDHGCSPTDQWIGHGIGQHMTMALAFSGDVRIDSVIMHGCRPATQYYTVTKACGQVILEINGKPAIQFIDELLDSAIAPEQYPFFLIFGVNHGEHWGEYDEDYYASRLCLGIDKESGGVVMFEPDMVEGTEFQLMFRSMELDYIKPKIDKAFDELDGREPVFAIYINCAGRCAGYSGSDLEDAVVIQKTVAGRVPVLGLYTGVEIASIGGRPRGLDWTGVFCLFSRSKDGAENQKKRAKSPMWADKAKSAESKEAPVSAMIRLCEKNAAKILAMDICSTIIRSELEQKRRSFILLSELSTSLRQNAGYDNVFIPAAKRINATLNMQKTVVLQRNDDNLFSAVVLQGYSVDEKAEFAGRYIEVPEELLDPDNQVLITGAEPKDKFREFRELLGLPFFTSSPVILQNEVFAILITGRLVEAPPYLVRLNNGDIETVKAISALLASVIAGQRLVAAEERGRILVDAAPMSCIFWDENGNLTDCNQEAVNLFGVESKEELLEKRFELSPEFIKKAYLSGGAKFNWTYFTTHGEPIPSEVTIVRIPKGEDYILAGYIQDLREAERNAKVRNEFLASVSHEIRTPINAIQAMARTALGISGTTEAQRNLINQGVRSTTLLSSAIEMILNFSKLDSGQMLLEAGSFSVRDLTEEIGGMVRKNAEEKALYLRASVDEDVPELLFGDSARLQQALFNIVINAVKFTEIGGVELRVFRCKADQNKEVWLTFEVRDTGIGVSDEQMTEIFQPLYTVETSYKRKRSGLGLGLPVSRGLAALMGGDITCESEPGKGSVFRLTVPFGMPEEKTDEADARQTLRGAKVLVAEDNAINQMIIEELLTSAGIEVTLAENGITAIEALEKDDFDVVLMDIQMPEMDGLTATARIRQDSRFDGIPIIAMTANAAPEHIEESINSGMNGHLTKPVVVEQLYDALLKWYKRGV